MPEIQQFKNLVQRVRDRDEEAARELTLKYENVIRRVVRIHLRDRRLRQMVDSMDICQSVLASFFVRTALGQFELERPEQLVQLLTTIARNKLANQSHRLKAQKRDLRKNLSIEGDEIPLLDRASNPADQVANKEILEKVRMSLDPQDMYLADQRAMGKSWQEIAAELGGSEVALRKRLSRALDKSLSDLGIEEVVYD